MSAAGIRDHQPPIRATHGKIGADQNCGILARTVDRGFGPTEAGKQTLDRFADR